MESMRWLRLAPLAILVAAGAVAAARPVAGAGADPPWEPPPCPAGGGGRPARGRRWYRLDPALDGAARWPAMRLTPGSPGRPGGAWTSRRSRSPRGRPVGGPRRRGRRARSRLSAAGRGARLRPRCSRRGVRDPQRRRGAGRAASLYEHRVDRRTRADLGVWRRELAAGTAVAPRTACWPGLRPDPATGRTFVTDLVVAGDGRLVVSSCGARACRIRVLDPATGAVAPVAGTGPAARRRPAAGSWCATRAPGGRAP